ncbi:MAG: 2-oxo acid dehydrogenase subunit E2 [Mycobacterium leprae]
MNLIPQGAPGAPGGMTLPGGTVDNPLAIGMSPWPPTVTVPLSMERMTSQWSLESNRAMAPVTVVAEVDATRLFALQEAMRPRVEATTGTPLSLDPFLARATIRALQAFPLMNATLTPQGFLVPRYVHLGVVREWPKGLAMPVIRNAERYGVADLAVELHRQRERARLGQLSSADMGSQTFVIVNNARWRHSLFGTPPIQSPNVGILAFEPVVRRPVVLDDDRIGVRPMMYITLSADHRAVDGVEIMGFVGKVKGLLENVDL